MRWQNGGCSWGYEYIWRDRVQGVLVTVLFEFFLMHHALAFDFLGEIYPLHITPERDVTLQYGTPFEASCLLNPSHPDAADRNSSNLEFTANRAVTLRQSILNETGIKLYVPDLKLGETLFHCRLHVKLGKPFMRPISVTVAELPKPVQNFKCHSPNWEKLVCNWTTPRNHVKTVYKGSLVLRGRAARKPIPCNDEEVKNSVCTFSGANYHKVHKEFQFVLIGRNVFGSSVQNFTINNHDVVIPGPPKNVEIVNRTSHSCLVKWMIQSQVHLLPVGLSVMIQVKNSWDADQSWETLNTSSIRIKTANYTYNITQLKYAGATYDIRIYLKSPKNTRYSEPAVQICNTVPTRPSGPPQTTAGCYDRYNHPIVNVYWKPLDYYLRNGGTFSYEIECVQDVNDTCMHQTVATSNTYAKFNLSLPGTYNFSIYSKNEIGRSENFSTIFVPIREEVPAPGGPTKVTFGEGAYDINWPHPSKATPHKYTVFYCEDVKERPLPCKGSIGWVDVPGNVTEKHITLGSKKLFHHFGVSAVYANGEGSEISWATCVISPGAGSTITELAIHVVLSQTAQVIWHLGCAENSIQGHFILYYCSVVFSEDSNECDGKQETLEIRDSHARNATLTDLKPYTTYAVEMAVKNKDFIGRKSPSRRFTTLEDAPDPPTNLTANNVTHSSVNLTWVLPENKNGAILRFYLHTSVNNSGIKESITRIDVQDKNNIDASYEVADLKSLTTYEFTLEACTQANCSKKSDSCTVTTRMHVPDTMHSPRIFIFNQTAANVSWDPPNYLSPSHIYQIRVQLVNQKVKKVLNYTGDTAIVPIDEFCTAFKTEIQFLIRAINIDVLNGKSYVSTWSKPETSRCYTANDGEFILVLICIIILSSVVTAALCTSFLLKLGYASCKDMKDVAVKLPSGLEPPQDLEKSGREIWPPAQRNSEHEITKIVRCGVEEESLLSCKLQHEDKLKANQAILSNSECKPLELDDLKGSSDSSWKDQTAEEKETDLVANGNDSSASSALLAGYSQMGCAVTPHGNYVTLAENEKNESPSKQGDLSYVTAPPLSATSANSANATSSSQANSSSSSPKLTESSFKNESAYPINDESLYQSEYEEAFDENEPDDCLCDITPPNHSATIHNYVPHTALKS